MITTDVDQVVADPDTDAVMICSSQPEHYEHVRTAILAGKAVFIEKPMVTLPEDFGQLLDLMEDRAQIVTLGLNRRYSPMVESVRQAIDEVDFVEYVITQPFVPAEHWTLDPVDGGGRLITEGEHFIDLCNLLIGKRPVSVTARALGKMPDDLRSLCNFALTLHYDGAVATVVFNESGSTAFPRERLTVLGKGRVAILDDFAKLTLHGHKVEKQGSGLRKSMGHKEELLQFVRAVQGQPNDLLTWDDASLATTCMFAAQESIRLGVEIDIATYRQVMLEGARADQPPSDVSGDEPDADEREADLIPAVAATEAAEPDPSDG
jgi:predicted dehydrogenase